MIDFIKEKIEIRRKVYLTDSNIILEDYRKEKEKIEEQDGRQFLEMLQNADDEAVTNKEKVCFIKLSENQLVIANNGNKFSEGGIESLMYSNISPKLLEQNKVGQKGLGFRSILSWARRITIKSYDFAVEFSEENAKDFLKSLIVQKPEILKQLNQKEKIEQLPIAILRCPKILDHIPNDLIDYDTYIIIELKEKQIKHVQEQINSEINKEVLLFLNNLEKIIVESPERNFKIEKEIHENKIIIREFDYKSDVSFEKVWNVKSKKGRYNDKNYELKIAWNECLDDNIGRLYSYFKTNVKFPFPALIHGTFDLTSDRNHFTPKSEHNNFLVDELIQLLIDTALEISIDDISYRPLKLLGIYGNENFDTFFEDNQFTYKLKKNIKTNKIYPTVNSEYISYDDMPIFFKNNYADILPAKKFKNLLLFTADKKIIETIEWLGYHTYNREDFFQSITEISNQFSVDQRASLISFLIKDYSNSDIEKKSLPNIFIDQSNQIIPSDSEIFLPPSGEKIEIPVKLNLKIINPDLFASLKKIFYSENAEVIEDRLKFFNVKVYRFSEIFRRIVFDFNNNLKSKINRRVSIKDLISNLYELYQLNKGKKSIDITIPTNISIPILNKNNGETKVGNVYLGKEYKNKLCEILYGYDKSKLVGSSKILGLSEKESVIEFLIWLGVAQYPRKKLITLKNDEYGLFALKRFPYREKLIYWSDATLDSYNKLKQKGYSISEIKVETIENLEELLKFNSNEHILYWLYCDSRITEMNETNSNSLIKLSIANKKYYTNIQHNDLPSFLLWKILNTKWVKTEIDKVSKPKDCCISRTITTDFSPFIEIPKINYEDILFKDAKISKEEIAYYLIRIGVKKEISDFSTATIYTMLSNLKDIDVNGKKAKLIYRELAENLGSKIIDTSTNEYKMFIDNGLVYCKKNGKYSYENVKSVYYVEDKTFGEDIVNKFYTIEIDRRKGAKKIYSLFGVKALENLEFQLKSTPVLHNLNKIFQKEINELKPYIYSFRLAKDTEEKELRWIKSSKITLCTQIEPQYRDHQDLIDFELKPYEFIYIEKKNEVYLLVDNGQKYTSITNMQSDYKFADSIAEIYSSILKVDTHRVSFSRLFEANSEKRSHIIITELDDKNLEKLKFSKKKLNIVDDLKMQFWFSILSTLDKDYEYKKYEDFEFNSLVFSRINLNPNDYGLNFENINDFSNFPIIIELFTKLRIDLPEFNENSTIALNFIPFFEEEIQQLQNDYQKKFETLLFVFLKSRILSEKETFLDKQFNYENYYQYPIQNTIYLDIEKVFLDAIYKVFEVNLTAKYENLDLAIIYRNNLRDLEDQIILLNKKVLSGILVDRNNLRSLLYFGEYESIIKEYKRFLANQDNSNVINFNNSSHKTNKGDLEELFAIISSNDPVTTILNINSIKPALTISDNKKSIFNVFSKKIDTSDLETLGFIGEVIVFESLKNKYGHENVIWDSGFAKKANINPKGDDNKHYDLKYKNRNNKWNFVEVKTTSSEKLEFKISISEVNFGIENKNNYQIMIVTNALEQKKNRTIKKLTNPFKFNKDESFTNNTKFFVKNESFTIKLNEE